MPFTVAAWSASQDSAVLLAAAALSDPHIVTAGNDIRVPDWATILLGCYVLGPNVTRAQLISPTLRRVFNPDLSPIDVAALPTSPHRAWMLMSDAIELTAAEALNFQFAENNAGASRGTALIWLADQVPDGIDAPTFTMRFTASFTAVANAWTNGVITFDQTLPPGEYACLGAHVRSTNLQAFRFVVPGSFFRPGGIGSAAISDILLPGQLRGGWGEWFRFLHTAPPTIDVLCNAADTAFTGELHLAPTGGG